MDKSSIETEMRIEELLKEMTLEEKVSLCHANSKFAIASVERLGIDELTMSDGPHGVRPEVERDSWKCLNRPEDACTYLPTGTALAATWNPQLGRLYGEVLGSEARYRGKDIILGPGVNLIRTPLCGRNFEYMSEDPCLISKMSPELVKGIQSQHIAPSVKHFALNNKETNRKESDSRVSERAAREIYLKVFEIIVKTSKPWYIMSSYNIINGHRASENHDLLTGILRDEWGFDGMVSTDWWTRGEHYKEVKAGNDLKMASGYPERLLAAVEAGVLTREEMETCVKRILDVILRLN